MKSKVLHVMIADKKFTLPLINYIIFDLKLDNHKFLVINSNNLCSINHNNVILIDNPLRKKLIVNFFVFCKQVLQAKRIIAHAAPLSFFFIFFPWKLKDIIWTIHGGIDIPKPKSPKNLIQLIDRTYKKKIGFHATHIEEDSNYTNKILSSNSIFLYSPMYLSNVIHKLKDEDGFLFKGGFNERIVLVGNSTDPSNKHQEAFNKLAISNLKPKSVLSILSYGIYEDYKNDVIRLGYEIFGSKFKPITEFLAMNEYLKLLNEIEYAIFNHERQEAMGVTIQLLSLGKPIFFNDKSPAFKSLKRRGYKVFSINDLISFKNVEQLDLRINRDLLIEQYSIDVLNSFYTQL